MRLYIAGPMSNVEDFNFPLFWKTAGILKSLGYEVENPADNDGATLEEALYNARALVSSAGGEGKSWGAYLKRDLPRVCKCGGVVVLPGWQNSRGATLEVDVAERLGMPVYTLLPYAVQSLSLDGEGPASVSYKLVPRVRAIGLSGYARTGKDTAARILVEDYGHVQGSFAAKLKELAERIDPFIDPYTGYRLGDVLNASSWEWTKDNRPESRRFLQALGTGVREVIGADTWVRLALRSLPDGSRAVFSDVRFPNEADAIKAAGGVVWRLEREGYGPVNNHISETALDDYEFDWHLYNNSDLEALKRNIVDAMDMAKLAGAA